MITVRIIECPDPYAWYSGRIGEEFNVIDPRNCTITEFKRPMSELLGDDYITVDSFIKIEPSAPVFKTPVCKVSPKDFLRIPRAHCEEVKPFGRRAWAKFLLVLTAISVTFSAFGDTDQRTQPRNRLKPNRHNERMD